MYLTTNLIALIYLVFLKSSANSVVQLKFKRMVARFQTYTDQDIFNLENNRLQHLIMGGRESLTEPKVVNAFCVLYEDILPVRFGGDILFNMLDKAIINAKRRKGPVVADEILKQKNVSIITNESRQTVKSILQYFLSQQLNQSTSTIDTNVIAYCCDSLFSDIDQNKDDRLSPEEFSEWILSVPLTSTEKSSIVAINNNISIALNQLNPKVLFQEIDANNDGKVSREEFQSWTTLCLTSKDEPAPDCDINYDSIENILTKELFVSADRCLEDIPLTSEASKKFRERYLHMVKSFAIWGDKLATVRNKDITTTTMTHTRDDDNSHNRIDIIVDGCFTGAKNKGVVKALGILYEDYFPLRVAGDIVFKLVENKMKHL